MSPAAYLKAFRGASVNWAVEPQAATSPVRGRHRQKASITHPSNNEVENFRLCMGELCHDRRGHGHCAHQPPVRALQRESWHLQASDISIIYVVYMGGALCGLLFLGRPARPGGFSAHDAVRPCAGAAWHLHQPGRMGTWPAFASAG